jgi:signal transduction histidine kinase
LLSAERDHAVLVETADTGPGIPPEQLPRLFDVSLGGKGERVAAGLGLATAQSITQPHGGELSVQSQVGEGATFCIRIPLGRLS